MQTLVFHVTLTNIAIVTTLLAIFVLHTHALHNRATSHQFSCESHRHALDSQSPRTFPRLANQRCICTQLQPQPQQHNIQTSTSIIQPQLRQARFIFSIQSLLDITRTEKAEFRVILKLNCPHASLPTMASIHTDPCNTYPQNAFSDPIEPNQPIQPNITPQLPYTASPQNHHLSNPLHHVPPPNSLQFTATQHLAPHLSPQIQPPLQKAQNPYQTSPNSSQTHFYTSHPDSLPPNPSQTQNLDPSILPITPSPPPELTASSALATYRKNVFTLFLTTAILLISTGDWILWKITLNRFHSKTSTTSYTFFVLQIYILMMLLLSGIAVWVSIYVTKSINNKQRRFPQYKFMLMSSFDCAAQLLSSMSSAVVAGHIQTLLNQAMLPLIMHFSIKFLYTRYHSGQYLGAALIFIGTIVAAIPSVNSTDLSGRRTQWWGLICYALSAIPFSFGNVYREYLFNGINEENYNAMRNEKYQKLRQTSQLDMNLDEDGDIFDVDVDGMGDVDIGHGFTQLEAYPMNVLGQNEDNFETHNLSQIPLKSINTLPELPTSASISSTKTTIIHTLFPKVPSKPVQLNIFYLMFWTGLYQSLFTLCTIPLLTLPIFGGTSLTQIPTQFTNGFQCFMGNYVEELECHIGRSPGFSLMLYLAFNFVVSILRLLLIQHASALMLQITNALALLSTNLVFSIHFIMGQYTESFHVFDFLGLFVVFLGFVIFRFYSGADQIDEGAICGGGNVKTTKQTDQLNELEEVKFLPFKHAPTSHHSLPARRTTSRKPKVERIVIQLGDK